MDKEVGNRTAFGTRQRSPATSEAAPVVATTAQGAARSATGAKRSPHPDPARSAAGEHKQVPTSRKILSQAARRRVRCLRRAVHDDAPPQAARAG